MKKIILAILIVAVLVIGAVVFEMKSRHDQALEQQGYANALKAMQQTGHDQHDTDYMNPKKSP